MDSKFSFPDLGSERSKPEHSSFSLDGLDSKLLLSALTLHLKCFDLFLISYQI